MNANIQLEKTGPYELKLYTDTNEIITLNEDLILGIWDMVELQRIQDVLKEFFSTDEETNFNILDHLETIADYFRAEREELNTQVLQTLIRLAIADYDYNNEETILSEEEYE